ncbi:MAG: transposase [Xanthobacteraceae bacterium]|nr:transposase [Xanthobacteraceae bacterium]
MRHSQFTDQEIAHLLLEASEGVPVAEICRTSHVSMRTFYRWKRKFGGLTPRAVLQMKDLEIENRRLRALVGTLTEQLKEVCSHSEKAPQSSSDQRATYSTLETVVHTARIRAREGVALGRFAGVRISG